MNAIEYCNTDILTCQDCDILLYLKHYPFKNQREIAESCGCSIGMVNKCLKKLKNYEYIESDNITTEFSRNLIDKRAPRNAIILAAGYGMRMVPINLSTPKALLEVNGEKLIERIIDQLHAVGVMDITVVAGFMKEELEYLIDEKGVKIVVNPEYANRNNLYSLALVKERIGNTYIIPSDIWCSENPFRSEEMYSWYMVSNESDEQSEVRVNRKMQLVKVQENEDGNRMVGIAYLLKEDADTLRANIDALIAGNKGRHLFWEAALYSGDRMIVNTRLVDSKSVIEINTYEQLRELDSGSNHLKSEAIDTIAKEFQCKPEDIMNISVLKKGMTNRSFLFSIDRKKYIMRIPGEGTEQLINRKHEADVFRAISGLGLCDDPVYINPDNGYKITKYLDDIRVCDAYDKEDLVRCMDKLRNFHKMEIQVEHSFDIFGQIRFYESLWGESRSIYKDYDVTKENVFSLQQFIEKQERNWCLTHIDAVADNFLFYAQPDGTEGLQLTDWEYAGMQDPHVDIAMFCLYSLYNKEQVDRLIDIYFDEKCEDAVRAKIYSYISACGLLWSNWCEYKRKLGVEFGEYSLCQYRFAKEYYRFAEELISKL